MKNKLFVFASLAAASLLLTACPSNEVMESKNISQSEIHQGYFVRYEADEQDLYVSAEFRAAGPNGTTLILSEPADAICNGTDMKIDTHIFGGAYYSYFKKENMGASKILEMKYVDIDKKSYENLIVINAVEIVKSESSALRKDSTTLIEIKGLPLTDSEEMKILLSGDSTSVEVPFNDGFTITPDNLKDFRKTEKVSAQVIRTAAGNIKDSTARGGSYSVTYNSKKKQYIIQ